MHVLHVPLLSAPHNIQYVLLMLIYCIKYSLSELIVKEPHSFTMSSQPEPEPVKPEPKLEPEPEPEHVPRALPHAPPRPRP